MQNLGVGIVSRSSLLVTGLPVMSRTTIQSTAFRFQECSIPMYHASSMCQFAGNGRGSAYHKDLEQLPVDWERGIIFHCKSILHLGIL